MWRRLSTQHCAGYSEILELPRESGGAFVTGATQANLCGLASARHSVLKRAGWDVEADGLFGAPPIKVVVSAKAHPTLIKALGVLGLGRSRVIKVGTDAQGRSSPNCCRCYPGRRSFACRPATSRTTGAFDPIDELCERAQAAGAWVHVDGAFGLWAAAAPTLRHLAKGMAMADSWATDAHKWLNVPTTAGSPLFATEMPPRCNGGRRRVPAGECIGSVALGLRP